MSAVQKNINIHTFEIKKEILKYLTSHVKINNIGNHYLSINRDRDLDVIMNKNHKYTVSLEKSGIRSWYMFFVANGIYFAISIPFGALTEDIKIYPVNLKVNKTLYEGTIFEGIYLIKGQLKYVYVNEVYLLEGNTMINYNRNERLNMISRCIEENFTRDTDFIFDVDFGEELFCSPQDKSHDDLLDENEEALQESNDMLISVSLIKQLYAKTKSDTSISAWNFYPNRLTEPIYFYSLRPNDRVDEITRIEIFKIKKTNTTDVYILYDTKDNVIGNAYIENSMVSKKFREQFEQNEKKYSSKKAQKNPQSSMMYAKCIYVNDFDGG